MEKIYDIVRAFALAIPFQEGNSFRPYLFFSGNHILTEDKKMVIVTEDIYEAEVNKRCDIIIGYVRKDEDPLTSLLVHISKPYRVQFLDFIKDYISGEELGKLLSWVWTQTEFPNQYGTGMLMELFKRADKDSLMDGGEKKILDGLPEVVEIYRGTQVKKAKIRGLSWTLSKAKAKWFADRWKTKSGKVYKATIARKDIYAYFDGRGEQEVVVNARRLKNVGVDNG